MVKTTEGTLASEDYRFAILASRFNNEVVEGLMSGAVECLARHGVADEFIEIYRAPGAFELPFLARRLAETRKFHALICLGALIRGETSHFEYLSREVTAGLSRISHECQIPIAFGVLTTNTREQAFERAGRGRNKGWEAAESALEMASLNTLIEDRE